MAHPTAGGSCRQRTKVAHDAPTNIPKEALPVGPKAKLSRSTRCPASRARTSKEEHPADEDSPDEISVAIEWKLLYPLLARGAEDPRPTDSRPIMKAHAVHPEKEFEALRAQAYSCVAETIRDCGEHAVMAHTIPQGYLERDYWESSWIVKKANSAMPLDEENALVGYIWVPVEICSPRVRFKAPETRSRLQRVLEALISRHRLAANASCEIHIHIGRMDGHTWSLWTLKRLGTLVWVAEPTLRRIRDPASPNFRNIFTWGFPLRDKSRLANAISSLSHIRTSKTHDPLLGIPDQQVVDSFRSLHRTPGLARELEAVSRIWKTTSHLELGQLLSGPEEMYRRLGFNFSAFGQEDDRARRNPRTVEFRFMEGSVCTNLILSWLTICCRIVEIALSRQDNGFYSGIRLSLQHLAEIEHLEMTKWFHSVQLVQGAVFSNQFKDLMKEFGVPHTEYEAFAKKIEQDWGHTG
jgi:Putative amidoligase enzyme.